MENIIFLMTFTTILMLGLGIGGAVAEIAIPQFVGSERIQSFILNLPMNWMKENISDKPLDNVKKKRIILNINKGKTKACTIHIELKQAHNSKM